MCYHSFILPMGRSHGFASTITDYSALFRLAFATDPYHKYLSLPATVTRRLIMQKARRHPTKGLRPLVSVWFQDLFHSVIHIDHGTKYRGQFEERMKVIIEELQNNPNIIVFIDEIHTIVGAGNSSGTMDASNIFKPALARGEIQCVGATTLDEYRKNFEKDGALERRFQKVIVDSPSKDETLQILKNAKEKYGLRTRLKSIPWEMPNSQAWIRYPVATDLVYKGYLLTNMISGGSDLGHNATAIIFNMQGKLVELEKEVFDSTGIFSGLEAGMTVLLSRDRSNCRFHVIQSECIPDTSASVQLGSCNFSFQIENGPGFNHCLQTTAKTCQKLNGSWTSGGTC